MATAAAKAVWPDNNREEPVSGQTGDVSKGEPYDAGNLEENLGTNGSATNDSPANAHATNGNVTKSSVVDTANPTTDGKTYDSAAPAVSSAPKPVTTAAPVVAAPAVSEPAPDVAVAPAASSESKPTAAATPAAATEQKSNPAVVKDSSVGRGDSTQAQNDIRDPEQPETNPAQAAPKENVDDSQPGPDTGDNPVKVDGPGPKPVAELANERGGDAGNVDTAGQQQGSDGGEEEEEGPKKKSTGEGTGEQYVKSSGLVADGGDFDASNPGAGREADRLREQKGVHIGGSNGPAPESSATEKVGSHDKHDKGDSAGGKPSLKERIKTKLHKP